MSPGVLTGTWWWSYAVINTNLFMNCLSIRLLFRSNSLIFWFGLWKEKWWRGFARVLAKSVGSKAPRMIAVTSWEWEWDVSKPLSHGRVILLDDGVKEWVAFKYERLPNIFYWCGCLNHIDKDCKLWFDNEGTLFVESQQFGL